MVLGLLYISKIFKILAGVLFYFILFYSFFKVEFTKSSLMTGRDVR